MSDKKNEQVYFTVSPKEKELLEKIAEDLGRPISAVVRDCAMNGLETVIRQYESLMEARKKMNLT